MDLLAIVRPPSRAEASSFHESRDVDVAELAELLAREADGSVTRKGDAIHVVLATKDERNVVVELEDGQARVLARLDDTHVHDEEHGTDEDDDAVNVAVEDVATHAIEILQTASGWYVFGSLADGFEPAGECPGCGVEWFAWQADSECAACGAELEDDDESSADDESDDVARAFVARLLRGSHVELVSEASRRAVESAVAASLARDIRSPEALMTLLVEQPGVAEVYADEATLARAMRAARASLRPAK